MLNQKDKDKIVTQVNKALTPYCVRVMYKSLPEEILNFLDENREKFDGVVEVVRCDSDASRAANSRNSGNKVLFAFSEDYYVDRYFSTVSKALTLPKALIDRARKSKLTC